jgi:competence protein ComEC
VTGGAATARVWLAVVGVVAGILLDRNGLPGPIAISSVAAGAVFSLSRRTAGVSLIGILLVASGMSALRASAPAGDERWEVGVATTYRLALNASLETAPDRAGALLAGLTIGDTSGVDASTTEAFRRSGLSHLVAVSGSNVAMVLAAIAIVTVRLPLVVRGGIGLGGLVLYVVVVGPEPSVLRAAAMGVVGLVAYVAGREAASLNSLGIALIAVLAGKPELLFSIGLHLSAAATLGIVVWSRGIERRLRRLPSLLRAPVAITLSAQIAVAPLLAIAFESLSLVAPVSNVLAAPAVPPATVVGLLSGLAGLVAVGAGRILAALAAPFAGWIVWVADETSGWSWASVDVPASWGWAMAVPVGLAALAGAIVRAGR